jgi:hypothetical protein
MVYAYVGKYPSAQEENMADVIWGKKSEKEEDEVMENVIEKGGRLQI